MVEDNFKLGLVVRNASENYFLSGVNPCLGLWVEVG
jgi:hypothetical protein